MHTKEDRELIHKGHRQRMRAKLSSHGPSIFDTYELLEMLLYYSIPYKDTNPLSKKLLMRFGGLLGVLGAEHGELMTVAGIGERTADLIVALSEVSETMGAELTDDNLPNFDDHLAVGEYLSSYFEERQRALFAVMLFDNDMRLIDIKSYEDRDYNSASVSARFFIELALKSSASVVITAQNKYYGIPVALPQDRETTKMRSAALSELKINHLEHYIVSGKSFSGTVSTVSKGLLCSDSVERFIKTRENSRRGGAL